MRFPLFDFAVVCVATFVCCEKRSRGNPITTCFHGSFSPGARGSKFSAKKLFANAISQGNFLSETRHLGGLKMMMLKMMNPMGSMPVCNLSSSGTNSQEFGRFFYLIKFNQKHKQCMNFRSISNLNLIL